MTCGSIAGRVPGQDTLAVRRRGCLCVPQPRGIGRGAPGVPRPPTAHLDFFAVEEIGVLGAVHQDLGPVPVLGAPRAVPSGCLVAALALQRGAFATRVAHGGGQRGPREAAREVPSGVSGLAPLESAVDGTGGHKGAGGRVRAPGTTPLGRGFGAGRRPAMGQQGQRGFTIALLPVERPRRDSKMLGEEFEPFPTTPLQRRPLPLPVLRRVRAAAGGGWRRRPGPRAGGGGRTRPHFRFRLGPARPQAPGKGPPSVRPRLRSRSRPRQDEATGGRQGARPRTGCLGAKIWGECLFWGESFFWALGSRFCVEQPRASL